MLEPREGVESACSELGSYVTESALENKHSQQKYEKWEDGFCSYAKRASAIGDEAIFIILRPLLNL